MKTLSKPTGFLVKRWVFLCLITLGLTSCQQPSHSYPSPQAPRPSPALNNSKKSPAPSPVSGYLGLSLSDASAKAHRAGRPSRVISIDGQSRPVTKDYRPRRLNFAVNQGKVTRITKG